MLPIRPTHDNVFIDIVDRDVTKKDLGNGKVLHLLGDDHFGLHDPVFGGKHAGIRPRWARVLAVGPEVEGDVEVGDLVLCDSLKWSRKVPLGRNGNEVVYFWNIKIDDILMIDESQPGDEYLKTFTELMASLELTIGRL